MQRNVRLWLRRRDCKAAAARRATTLREIVAATRIQAWWRGCLQLVIYEDTKIATITIQRWWRTQKFRDNFLKMRQAMIVIQCFARRYLARLELRRLQAELQSERRAISENLAAIVIQSTWKGYFVRQGIKESVRAANVIKRAIRAHLARKKSRELKNAEKFLTMKKLEAITPPPNFTPATPDAMNQAFIFDNFDDDQLVVVDKAKEREHLTEKSAQKDRRKSNRQSPESKWRIPEQLVDVRDHDVGVEMTSDGPIKPPTNHLTEQPYQVQLVRKETLRSKVTYPNPMRRASWMEMEHMIPKADISEASMTEANRRLDEECFERRKSIEADTVDGVTVKKANRKHKRDQEKQMLKAQLPQSQRPPRPKSKSRRDESRRNSEELSEPMLRVER